jgi:hypothetical protein
VFKKLLITIALISPIAFVLGKILEVVISGCGICKFGHDCPTCSIRRTIDTLEFFGYLFSIIEIILVLPVFVAGLFAYGIVDTWRKNKGQ